MTPQKIANVRDAARATRALFVDHWASVPLRLHGRGVEPESRLGSPRLSPAFLRRLSQSPRATETVRRSVSCGHHRLRDRPEHECPDCAGTGTYESVTEVFVDPLAAALDSLAKRPGTWPAGVMPPAAFLLRFASSGFSVRSIAATAGLSEHKAARLVVLSATRLLARYSDKPPARVAWTDKSESQVAAEEEIAPRMADVV